MQIMTLEQFRAGKIPLLDHGRLAYPHGCSKAQARRNQKYLDELFRERAIAMHETRMEYECLVAAGEIREPTAYESLIQKAAGNPEMPSVQAARRVLEKRNARLQLNGGTAYAETNRKTEHGGLVPPR